MASASKVVLVEYYVTPERTLIFGAVADAASPEVAKVDLGREEVEDLARRARERTHGLAGEMLVGLLAEPRLSDLVAPLARWARPEDLVYLVPHGALHLLPLAALPVEGKPLIDRNPVAVTPSSSVLQHCRAKRTGHRASAVIVSGPPGERPLLFARGHAYAVAAGFEKAEVLDGAAARRETLLRRLGPDSVAPDILHFACHGVFDAEEPMRSGIELAEGRLTAEDFLRLRLRTDLVTLGACETGVSERRPGDELMGLTRALLYAGAPSLLVTLWDVDELSASMLFSRFYADLNDGTSKAESLRRAQRWLRDRTLAQTLAYAEELRERLRHDQTAEVSLVCELARLRLRAGDPAGAQALLTDVLHRSDLPERLRLYVDIALRQTQVLALDMSDGSTALRPYHDPYYWAPFVLVGDWW